MIGSAQLQSVGVVVTPTYDVLLSPGSIQVFSDNGGASSSTVRSTVIDGVGPFTYLWVITGSDISINSPTSADTKFNSGGYETEFSEIATLTVTDDGNAGAETFQNISITFDFAGRN